MSCNTLGSTNLEQAKDLANKLLSKNCLIEPPVIAAELAKQAGLKVIPVNFEDIDPKYSSISGFINAKKNRLYVNSADSPGEQNFTIAHELGHFLLDHTNRNDYSNLLYKQLSPDLETSPIEKEANLFAFNLLIPEKALRTSIKKYPFANNLQLANLFGVSESVMRIRRQNIGV